jgi:AAA domain, putative AbiEii toxin, Type IV TA system
VDDPRAAEEAEALQAIVARLKDEMADADQERPDLAGSDRTLVIDEIDTSLHSLLVRKLVGLFRDTALNVGRAQLLFTAHDAFLLAAVKNIPTVRLNFTRSRTSSHVLSTTLPGVIWVGRMASSRLRFPDFKTA